MYNQIEMTNLPKVIRVAGILPKTCITPFSPITWIILEHKLLLISCCFHTYPNQPHYPTNNIPGFNRGVPVTCIHNSDRQADSPNPESLYKKGNSLMRFFEIGIKTCNSRNITAKGTWKIQNTANFPKLLCILSNRRSSPRCAILDIIRKEKC
jgi:hypothetical protein